MAYDAASGELLPAVVLPRIHPRVLVEIRPLSIDQRNRLLELECCEVAWSGNGLRNVEAVIGHVDGRAQLPSIRLYDVELPAGNSRIVFRGELEADLAALAQRYRRALDKLL